MSNRKNTLCVFSLALVVLTLYFSPAFAESVTLDASLDNSMYQQFPSNSNGMGDHFFTGNTLNSYHQRALIAFDIAGNIPIGATITSAVLNITSTRTVAAGVESVSVHLMLAEWGEGTSDAPLEEGQGAPATPNDATWSHRLWPDSLWTNPGGDFNPILSAKEEVVPYLSMDFETPAMASDVQYWLDNPDRNYGWILIGDESQPQTANRFDSRQGAGQPQLYIEYALPPVPTVSEWGLAVLVLGLLIVGVFVIRRRLGVA